MADIDITKSTIMFTDIAGYSSMVSRDEKGAMKLLSMHDKIIEPILNDHGGKIIKKIGDSIFARFNSPLDGVETAIKIQQKLKTRNSISDSQNKFKIRIGLHIGNVIEKDNDLFGHDVNLCSRIESIAPIGGIAVSNDMILACNDTNNINSREMGHVKLKNIPTPQQIYKIYLDSQEYEAETPKMMQRKLIENGINIIDINKYTAKDIFSIAILYINNMGSDEDEMIAYNLTENINSDLEYIELVRTPSFNDILQYKGTTLSTSDIARKVEVDNVLRGSMLKSEDTLHLSFDLIDINSGKILWEDKWTEPIVNEKNIRRHIITAILDKFNLQLTDQLDAIYAKNITNNQEALEIYYKARYFSDTMNTKSDMEEAKILLESAIQIDNNFVIAYASIALLLQRLGEFDEAEINLDTGKEIALEKNDIAGLASIFNILGIIHFTKGQYQKSRENSEKSLEYHLQLNNKIKLAKVRSNYAQCLNKLNEIDLAMEQNEESIKINKEFENYKSLGISYAVMANTYFAGGKLSQAFEQGIKSLAMCRVNHMKNFEGRISAIVADILLHIGKYNEMLNYAQEAESILVDFDEPFIMGKLEMMHYYYYLNQGDLDEAKDHIDSSIDLFEIAEHRPNLIDAYICKLQLLLEQNKLPFAKKVLMKIDMQYKKLAKSKKNPLLEIFRLNLSSDNLEIDDIKRLESEVITSEFAEKIVSYWYLAKIYELLEDTDSAKKCLNKATETIKQQSIMISNEEDRDCFINQVYLHKNILRYLAK